MDIKNNKPKIKPHNPSFGSGPCSKRPGWNLSALKNTCTGRSHRSKLGLSRIQNVIEIMRELLRIPKDYLVAIVPGSATGAFEMLLWNLLGSRPVDVLSWEHFGNEWKVDIETQLKLPNVRYLEATYGHLPELGLVDFAKDVVFAWTGTTSGVSVPDGDWIKDNRSGLTFCDGVSAMFTLDMPWHKLDATSFAWQKALGGEAAHGVIVLSPRAMERLNHYTPKWPIPKVLRLKNNDKILEKLFLGHTLNTPSMLCIEDALDALNWAISIGGLDSLTSRTNINQQLIRDWVRNSTWANFFAENEDIISKTPICIKIIHPFYLTMSEQEQRNFIKEIATILDEENVAFDIRGHMAAPPNIRLWCGPTIESSDIKLLLTWLDFAFNEVLQKLLLKSHF